MVNAMSYWTFTDIFEEAGPPVTPFHGGFGLINLQGIKKPSFWAYQFLNELSNIELNNDDSGSIVCKGKNDSLQALVWNYTLLSPDSSYSQQFYRHVIKPKAAGTVKLKIRNIGDGRYKLSVYKIGYHQNDPYSTYLEMGAPYNISLEQEKQLKDLSSGQPSYSTNITVNHKNWETFFKIDQNEVVFINIQRLRK